MKKKLSYIRFLIALTLLAFASCGKEDGPSKDEILHKKITDIIPQGFIDSLTSLGLPVYTETSPLNVEGSYFINPDILRASNIPTDKVGDQFKSAKFKLFNQHTDDFGIDLIGEDFFGDKDTSIVTAIAGSGNYFTVYGKVESYAGDNEATIAILISGIKNGNNLDSIAVGLININDSLDNDKIFIREGQARVAYDADYVSEYIDFDNNTSSFDNKTMLLRSIGIRK